MSDFYSDSARRRLEQIEAERAAALRGPSANITGVNNYLADIGAKRLELLREFVPNASVIGILVNPKFPDAQSQSRDVEAAARLVGQQIHIISASSERELDAVSDTLDQQRARGLIVTVDPFLNLHRDQIINVAARHRIAAMYFEREFVLAGGLMSYASNLADGYRQAGTYSTSSGAPPATSTASSKARSRPTCRFKRLPNMSW
jgi:putative ABC transport system substrate-binding protein